MSIRLNQELGIILNQEPISNCRESGHSDLDPTTEKIRQLQASTKMLMPKAKEAESLTKQPIRITRQASVGKLNYGKVNKSEKEEIASRSAEIWDCVTRKPNKLGGYVYVFKMKAEYEPYTKYSASLGRDPDACLKAFEALNEKSKMIYPAVEVMRLNPIDLILGNIPENISLVQPACDELPKELGFSRSGQGKDMLVNLPDRDALMANWEQLRETRPELPPLDIATGEGIANDIEFAEAYFTHDVLLSSGKEFFHDWIAHVTPTLLQMVRLSSGNPTLGKPSFKKERARMVKILAKTYRTITIVKQEIDAGKYDGLKRGNIVGKLNFVLGYITDLVSNKSDESWEQEDIDAKSKIVWDHSSTLLSRQYFQRRFGRDNLSDVPYETIWERAKQIEAQFKLSLKK